jgi:hypothetical protein
MNPPRPSITSQVCHSVSQLDSLPVCQSVSLSGSHLNSACMDTKPGKCFSEQVGVKAPGTPTTMVRFPARRAVQGRSLAQGMDQSYFRSTPQNFRAWSSLNFDEGFGKHAHTRGHLASGMVRTNPQKWMRCRPHRLLLSPRRSIQCAWSCTMAPSLRGRCKPARLSEASVEASPFGAGPRARCNRQYAAMSRPRLQRAGLVVLLGAVVVWDRVGSGEARARTSGRGTNPAAGNPPPPHTSHVFSRTRQHQTAQPKSHFLQSWVGFLLFFSLSKCRGGEGRVLIWSGACGATWATNLLPYKDVWDGFLACEGDEGAADVASPDFFVDLIDAVPCTSCIVRRGQGSGSSKGGR